MGKTTQTRPSSSSVTNYSSGFKSFVRSFLDYVHLTKKNGHSRRGDIPVSDKFDAFVLKHFGQKYSLFKRNFEKDGRRTRAYLFALENCEERGYDIKNLLEELKARKRGQPSRILVQLLESRYDAPLADFSREPTNMRFGNYDAEIRLPLESDIDPIENERLQVVLTANEGRQLYADFVTTRYLEAMFNGVLEDCGEGADGSYYPNKPVIVKNLSRDTVEKTLSDIVKYEVVDSFFRQI